MRFLLCSLCVAMLSACDASIGGANGNPNNPNVPTGPNGPGINRNALNCDVRESGTQSLRRLSSLQLENAVRDIFPEALGAQLASIANFPQTEIDSGFSTDVHANAVNTTVSNALEDAAERMASYLLNNAASVLPQVMPCGTSSYSNADVHACIDTFIDAFAPRVYRRPITAEERTILRGLYDAVNATQTSTEAWSAVVMGMFASPQFVYFAEAPQAPVAGSQGLHTIDGFAMASRLSFFLTNTVPDDALLAAAAAGELSAPESVEAHARRLIERPEATDVVAEFNREWLGLYSADQLGKDQNLFPEVDAMAQAALADEIGLVTRHVLSEPNATIADLLTVNDYPVSAPLAPLYGLSGAGVALDGDAPRSGLLTTTAFLSAHAHPNQTSPVERGVFIRHALLCGDTGVPTVSDETIEQVLGPAQNAPTARERLAPLVENSDCAGCHSTFNPLGLALENYDAVGRWRDAENGRAIDVSGEIQLAGDANGSFMTAAQYVSLIASSTTAQYCYAERFFRYAFGRLQTEADNCDLAMLQDTLDATGGNIRELMVAMTKTNSFLYKRVED